MGEEKIGIAQGMESGSFCQRARRKFTGKSLHESYLTWCEDVFIQASVYTGAKLSVKKWAAPFRGMRPESEENTTAASVGGRKCRCALHV